MTDLTDYPIPPDQEQLYNDYIKMGFKEVYIYYNHMTNKYVTNVIDPYKIFKTGDTWVQVLREYKSPDELKRIEKKKLKHSQTKLEL